MLRSKLLGQLLRIRVFEKRDSMLDAVQSDVHVDASLIFFFRVFIVDVIFALLTWVFDCLVIRKFVSSWSFNLFSVSLNLNLSGRLSTLDCVSVLASTTSLANRSFLLLSHSVMSLDVNSLRFLNMASIGVN